MIVCALGKILFHSKNTLISTKKKVKKCLVGLDNKKIQLCDINDEILISMKFLKFCKDAVLAQFCICRVLLDVLLSLMLEEGIYVKPASELLCSSKS